jgi:3-oxoacyl-[acyl-carrier-protein] synthase-3
MTRGERADGASDIEPPMDPVWLVAGGLAHPDTTLTNRELEESLPQLEPGWIAERLGIESRRVLTADEDLGELARRALDAALADAGWSRQSVDLVIGATSFVDDILPATASWIARDACPAAVAFDVNAACASGPFALSVASSMLHTTPRIGRAAVCAAERPTAWADYDDPESCVYWGDSAGCLLLQREQPSAGFRIVTVALLNDNTHPEKVRVPRLGTFAHDGRYSYEQVCILTEKAASRVLSDAGLSASDVVAFIGHQSNIRLLHAVGDRLGIPWARQWHNVEWAGNQGGAGVITAFIQGWKRHRNELRDGDHVLLAAVGGGYTSGAVLLRWESDGTA